jgi:chromosome partitioning protein
MTTIISAVNQKGGVAKTTTVLNLGVALGSLGKRVLLVDLDFQNTLSYAAGCEVPEGEASLYTFLFEEEQRLVDVVKRNIAENVDLLPSSEDLAAADLELVSELGRERLLGDRLGKYVGEYDFVLIDNTPALNLLVVNALTASDFFLVPVTCTPWAIRGLKQLLGTVQQIKRKLNPSLQMMGVLITRYAKQHTNAKDTLEFLEETFGDKLFSQRIKETNRFEKVALEQSTVFNAQGTGDLAVMYRDFAEEVIRRAR